MNITKRSLFNALGVVVYIALIVTCLNLAGKIFADQPDNNFLAPMVMLTLFVVSAATTGGLVLAKPVMMYMDGQKSEAFKLFMYTVGWLALFLVCLIVVMVAVR